MSDEVLRYPDLAAAIQMARGAGMTTRGIVGEVTRSMSYAETLKVGQAHSSLARPGGVRVHAAAEE